MMAAAKKCIIVKAGVDDFALSVDHVSSIEKAQMTSGTAEIRGESIHVVSLRDLMNSASTEDRATTAAGKIVIVESSGKKAGLYVDETSTVKEMIELAYPLPAELGMETGSMVNGVVQLDDQLVILLEIPEILNEIEEMGIMG
ncbi:chemotaxis protein CheW [Fictibacillus iocasae]|uniref:Chemotaxis protein CheW n=1 Tax=Fictibacillus iocasae TaxID=2715437 RepID=A0ABW2NQ66_9BACL